jgi:hypothetical protein
MGLTFGVALEIPIHVNLIFEEDERKKIEALD